MKTLYLIHHTHTDVGYTELQGRLERRHADFIRQALRIIEESRGRRGPHFDGFRWQCETFWTVERFLEQGTPSEIEAFRRAVAAGDVGVSGSYLNLNELAGDELLRTVTRRAADFGRSIGVRVDSAMTADVNGASWGFPQALVDHGVENLFACVHTHHGMYPLGRKQVPFWWETPRGDRVLVWNGEHYHFGNELGLVPAAVSSYLTKDECDAGTVHSDNWAVAEIRIPRYLGGLEQDGYPYDFVPVMASGLRSDNAPPSPLIVDFIERWNEAHGDETRIEMTTLSSFFRRLRDEPGEIPCHRGDWPDWWSDGPSADATSTALFREAQRRFGLARALAAHGSAKGPPDARPTEPPDTRSTGLPNARSIEDDLILYAEHTFSHAVAMSDPWHPLVRSIAERNRANAARAHDAVEALLDGTLAGLGAAGLAVGTPLRYRAVNPLDHPVSGLARLLVGHYEFHELGLDRGAEVTDTATGERLPSQLANTPLGGEYSAPVRLAAGEERTFEISAVDGAGRWPTHAEDEGALETPFVRIEWRAGDGVVRWLDRVTGRELLRPDRGHEAFTPVYEVTPVPGRDEICSVRGKMRLNRKGENARRTPGCLVGSSGTDAGDATVSTTLDYGVPGMSTYLVELRAHVAEPRVDVAVRFHKDSVWEPENVYVSLPFAVGEDGALWLDKAGAAVRPRVDQIPGTLTDFYSIQEGLAIVSGDRGLAVATRDGHLVQLGRLEPGERRLAGDPALANDPAHVYAWLMTNYWETNFAASLGGFHEFRFSVKWGPGLADPADALRACRDMNLGIVCFRIK